jgi:hypothetical protein
MSDNEWSNRITAYKQVPVNQLLANPLNARQHPPRQREALRGSLATLGWVAPVIVNTRTGYMLDGHARAEELLTRDENALIPVIEVDLSEDEERLFLASYDWITSLATYDRASLDALLQEVNTDNGNLQTMLAEMASSQGLYDSFNPMDEWDGMPEFEQETNYGFHSIRVHFETETDLQVFAQLVQQNITDKTTYIYYPQQVKRNPSEIVIADES